MNFLLRVLWSRLERAQVWMALLVFLMVGVGSTAFADSRDYAPTNEQWNGLSEFFATCKRVSSRTDWPRRVNLSELSEGASLLFIYPRARLPSAMLLERLRKGARLAVADDFGAGDQLFSVFQISRHPAPARDRPTVLKNPNLLVAATRGRHELVRGLQAVVTNHPQTLRHAHLIPVLYLGDPKDGVVLAGAVGEGRFVAMGDPSLLINNMMRFRGNRVFAENLVRYLTNEDTASLLVITPETIVETDEASSGRSTLRELSNAVRHLAAIHVRPIALKATTAFLCCVLVFAAALTFAKRSPYRLLAERLSGGTAHTPTHASAHAARVAILYRDEIEREIVERIFGDARPESWDIGDLRQHMRARGVPEPLIAECAHVLSGLESIEMKIERRGTRGIREKDVAAIVARGEALLARQDFAMSKETRWKFGKR